MELDEIPAQREKIAAAFFRQQEDHPCWVCGQDKVYNEAEDRFVCPDAMIGEWEPCRWHDDVVAAWEARDDTGRWVPVCSACADEWPDKQVRPWRQV